MGTAEVTDQQIEESRSKWDSKIDLDEVLEEFEGDHTAKSVLDAASHRGCPELIGAVFLSVRSALIERLALADCYECYVADLPKYLKLQDAGQAAVSAANAWALKKAASK